MQTIYEIVKKLQSHEIRRIKAQFKTAQFEYEKVERLFELVTHNELQPEEFYAEKLYGKAPDNAFRVTKSRLKRVLYNAILHDKSLDDYETAAINARLQARKRLLQAEILLGRGAYNAGQELLHHVIAEAKRFSLPDELFFAEMLLYRVRSMVSSVTAFERETQEVLHLNKTRADIQEALILHYSVKNLLINLTLNDEQLREVRRKVDRIRDIEAQTQHPQVRNAYYLSEIYYLQTTDQFSEALLFCHKYLDLLRNDTTQYSPKTLPGAYINLVQVCLQLEQTDEARVYVQEVLSRYRPEDGNYLAGLDLGFRVEYHAKNYAAAQRYIEQAMLHPAINMSKTMPAKWHYFNACLMFCLGRFKESNHALNLTAPLLADKQGLNLYIRVLEVMLIHELGNDDMLETRITNMKEFVRRTQRTHDTFRPQQLIQLLLIWHRKNYDFEKTLVAAETTLEKLAAYHREVPFKRSGMELIRLEEWLQDKRHW